MTRRKKIERFRLEPALDAWTRTFGGRISSRQIKRTWNIGDTLEVIEVKTGNVKWPHVYLLRIVNEKGKVLHSKIHRSYKSAEREALGYVHEYEKIGRRWR